MKEKILIDIGSSTIKIYKLVEDNLRLISSKSVFFKTDYINAKHELLQILSEIKKTNPNSLVKLYATAFFRKLDAQSRNSLVDETFEKTGLYINVISHDLESFYLQKALIGKYSGDKKLLLVNIGGGSTELVVVQNNDLLGITNIEVGVGTILEKFPNINEQISGASVEEVKDFISSFFTNINTKVDLSFYSGGELNYMKLANYKLDKNTIFKDSDHPDIISLHSFKKKNKEVFENIKLSDLESLMPENPKWMHGARACSALAEVIFEKFGTKTIIPSDSNLVNGIVRQEFRTVTLSGSFRKHLDYILETREKLVNQGVRVLSPRFTKPKNPGEEFVVFAGEEDSTPLSLERHHLEAIDQSDALIVCDPGGYVGASALLEIGYAQDQKKRIIFTEKPEEFMLNTLPAEVGL